MANSEIIYLLYQDEHKAQRTFAENVFLPGVKANSTKQELSNEKYIVDDIEYNSSEKNCQEHLRKRILNQTQCSRKNLEKSLKEVKENA